MRPFRTLLSSLMLGIASAYAQAQPTTQLPDDVSISWWQAVQKNIRESEYHIRPKGDGAFSSPNRAQNLRFTYAERGFSATRRDSLAHLWKAELAYIGVSKQKDIARDEATFELRADANTLVATSEKLLMRYRNDEKGMRQDFIVKKKPSGKEQLRLWLEAKMTGGKVDAKPDAIAFLVDGGAEAMRYSELKVWDASGKRLTARFEGEGERIAIVVDDRKAMYPITIDPLSATPNWTAESNQDFAYFGWSVASAGDVNGDGFSDVMVGAYLFDNGQPDEGRAFVYHGSASGLSATANWTAESNQASAEFGYSVASAGDVNGDGFSDVIVGARLFDNGQTDEGRAFVYHGSASGLSATPNWTAESNQTNAQFGWSASSAGDVNGDGFSDVIVGAYLFDNGQTDEGRAFVYHGSASGLSATAAWTAESNQASAQFGISASSAGDVNGDGFSDVIVGARFFDNGESDEGRAFLYHGSASGLSATENWTAESNQASAEFGYSVASAGDVNGDGFSDVIVGAYRFSNGQFGEGGAFVYHGSASGLSTTPNWTAESNQANAWFGWSVSSAGDVNGDGFSDVIVSAPTFDNPVDNEGGAFVYHGSASGLSTSPNWTAKGNQLDAQFGISVASAGDVNGDGFSDVIVGAYLFDNGETDEGAAAVYHGSASGLSATHNWTAESNQVNAEFGASVSSAGDVNGDGFSDVIVGARGFDNGESNEGRAFVYHGSASGLSTTPNWTAESNQAGAEFGISVASAGDVNGDGFSDVIVGAYLFDNGQLGEGWAFVYHGSASGLSTSPNWTAESNQANAFFGVSVSSAGDVNGDGFSDVIVGAPFFDNGQTDEGRAFVYHGSASGLSTSPNWTAESNQAGAFFGYSVASAGDVNGDGFSDVIVGAYYFDNGQTDEGRAFVYHGSASGLSTTPNWTAESNQVGAEFGYSVSSAGDVNGDGFSDVIVGARFFDNGQSNEGAAFVYHGSASGLSATENWTAESNQTDANFGISVASAGDVNGDGFSDVIVGAYRFDNPESNEGRTFVYYGNEGGGLRQDLRQFRPSTTTPIVPALKTQSLAGVTLRKRQKSIAGRSNTKLQIEVKPLGTPFNGLGLQETSFALHATTGTPTDLTVGALANNTLYKWRVRQVERPSGIGYALLPRSRWYYPAGVAPTESHFKVGVSVPDYTGPTAGIAPGAYNNVTFTASGNLPGNVTVDGALTLNSGVVSNLNGNSITVNNAASGAIAGAGFLAGSGSLVRAFSGNNAYAFPYVQSGDNRSATVTFTSGAGTGTLTYQFFNAPPGTTGLPQTIVGQVINVIAPFYWRIDATGTPGTYTLALRAQNTDGVTNVATLRIAKRPNAGSWSATGAGTGSANTGTLADPTVAQSGMTGFSEFSIGGGGGSDNPLPVELSAFSGNATREGVRLSWTTASEMNNAGFEVRRSETGSDFQTIASYAFSPELKGRGTVTSATNYEFLDANVEAGKTYLYRLRSVDYDGTLHDYAQTVTVEVREPVQPKVYEYALWQNYPNPFNPTTTIRFTMKEAGTATLTITDVLGRVALTETIQASVGENAYRFNALNLGSGVYFYTLRAGAFQQTKKMMLVK